MYQTLDHSTTKSIKSIAGIALSVVENQHFNKDDTLLDNEEGNLSQTYIQDAKNDLRFSSFAELVKPSPFQKASPDVFPESKNQNGSPIIQKGLFIPLALNSNRQSDLVSEIGTNDKSGISECSPLSIGSPTRSILKKGTKSRYAYCFTPVH